MAPPLETIVQTWDAALRGYVSRRIRDHHAVEDVVQETWLRIHRHLPSLRSETRMAPWLFRIARNAVTDHHRRQGRVSAPRPGLDETAITAPAPDTEDDLDRQVGGWLQGYLPALETADREILEAVDVRGESQAAVAKQRGLAPSTVRSRVQRARRRLRTLLEACCRIVLDRRGHVVDVQPGCDASCEDC